MSNTIASQTTAATLSIRTTGNPNHHLWFNNGTWWVHYTEHLPDFTKRRVRRSLHTGELGIARVLRDTILREAEGGAPVFEEEVPRRIPLAIAA